MSIRSIARRRRIKLTVVDRYWSILRVGEFFGSAMAKPQHKARLYDYLPFEVMHTGAGVMCRTRESSVERLIREQPWAYNPDCLLPPDHRLAVLARAIHRRNRWLTVEQYAPLVGISRTAFWRWIEAGIVPHRWRVLGMVGRGRKGKGQVVISVAELDGIRREIAAAKLTIQARGNATRALARHFERAA